MLWILKKLCKVIKDHPLILKFLHSISLFVIFLDEKMNSLSFSYDSSDPHPINKYLSTLSNLICLNPKRNITLFSGISSFSMYELHAIIWLFLLSRLFSIAGSSAINKTSFAASKLIIDVYILPNHRNFWCFLLEGCLSNILMSIKDVFFDLPDLNHIYKLTPPHN